MAKKSAESGVWSAKYKMANGEWRIEKTDNGCSCMRTKFPNFPIDKFPKSMNQSTKSHYLRRFMEKKKGIVMSGIRPTGYLHLGNYFGAVKNYVRMQEDYECFFMVADLHSLTTHPDTKELKQNVHRVLAENIACGLDPDKVALYCQSHVYETSELYLYLNMLAYQGELERTTTFKDKVRQQPDNVNAGLLTYPVLQAADILVHRALKVPVGKDQEQHIEMTRNFAERFNY